MITFIIVFGLFLWWLNSQTGTRSQAERILGKDNARIHELEEEIRILRGDK